MPSDSPEGGINFYTVTTLMNPRYVTTFQLDVLPSKERPLARSNSTSVPLFSICSIRTCF
jgi:hypothetical protein